jgi:intein/homing endonuclease
MADDYVRSLVLLRHRRSMSQYLKDGREKAYHVTDFVYGCPRYAKWIYDLRMQENSEDRPLSERDMTVFTIGKKLDELPVGDWHHVKIRKTIGGLEIVGEIDDLIIDEDLAIIIDKKHIRGRPPKEAHSHYIAQVNTYAYFLKSGCAIDSVEAGDLKELSRRLKDVNYYHGAVLYIDVGLETAVISDVVDWEIGDREFEQTRESLSFMVSSIIVAKGGAPEPHVSWFCVPAGELILGDNKPIESYNIGDVVLSTSGSSTVSYTFKRWYEGEIVKIKGLGLLPIYLTPEHPVLVKREYWVTHPYGKVDEGLQWKLAGELDVKRDKLLLPILPTRENELCVDVTVKGMVRKYSLPLNRDLAWLLGIYVAEGHFDGQCAVLTIGKHEAELANNIKSVVGRLGLNCYEDFVRTSRRIRITSTIFGRALDKLCGHGAANKKVPDGLLFAGRDVIEAFIEGYESGDGHYYYNVGRGTAVKTMVAVTVSKTLALQLQLLYAKVGRWLNIHYHPTKGKHVIEGRVVNVKPSYSMQSAKEYNAKGHKWIDGYVTVPIISLERLPYSGYVYNLETTDNTYLISNAVVHNCQYCPFLRRCSEVGIG